MEHPENIRDKENVDPRMERNAFPQKSILKDNTLPILNNRRRVSFAPEVTLHKFDFVPYTSQNGSNKRRKTISGFPSLSHGSVGFEHEISVAGTENADVEELYNSPEDGLEMLVDSDSSDEEPEIEDLERAADAAVVGMAKLNEKIQNASLIIEDTFSRSTSILERNDDSDEEQTMELTEQIQIQQVVLIPPEKEIEPVANQELSAVHMATSSDDEEQSSDMELTGTQRIAPQPSVQNFVKESNEVQEVDVLHDKEELVQEIEEEVTMELTQPFSIAQVVHEDHTLTTITEESNEPTIERVSQSAANEVSNNGNGNQNSEITSTENVVVETKEYSGEHLQDNILNNDSQEEQTMEFTQAVNTIEPNTEQVDQTMEITQSISTITKSNIGEQEQEQEELAEEEETPMELTQAISTISSSHVQTSEPLQNTEVLSKREVSTFEQENNEQENKEKADQEQENQVNDIGLDTTVPMELTQTNNEITNIGPEEKSHSTNDSNIVSMTMDETSMIMDSSSISIAQEVVSTTKIPLAELSQVESADEDYDDYEPVSLDDFMNDVQLKFYDDLDIDVDSINRLSVTSSSKGLNLKLADYIAGLPRIELLSLYRFSCEELSKNIKEGRDMFLQYSKTIAVSNPILFKEYYSASEDERQVLNVKLQLVKDFSRFQSRKTWYDWRSQLTTNLLAELEDRYQRLVKDKDYLERDIVKIDVIISRSRQYLVELKERITSLRSFRSRLGEFSVEEALSIKKQLLLTSEKLSKLKDELQNKNDELSKINDAVTETKKQKQILNEEIAEQEKIVRNSRRFEMKELNTICQKYSLLQKLANLKLERIEGSKVVFQFDKTFDCVFDFQKENPRADYSVREDVSCQLYNPKLLEKLSDFILPVVKGDNVVDNFKSFAALWKVIKKIDMDIYKVSNKFPVQWIQEEGHLAFSVHYYNSTGYKYLLTCKLKLDDLMNYASRMQLSGTIVRSIIDLEEEQIKSDIIGDLAGNGIVSMESLKTLMTM
ncbi:hypothetical protein G9P44_004243 [Scheffersomyces stipitis]|nr:hypothetical protein G9P44_004243 [Scheffersomyces stipitis]